MGVWAWYFAYRNDARARDDAERLRLTSLFEESEKFRETDPQRSLELVREARALAVQLREPWWVLLMDHWRLQCLLHYLREIPPALELAVQATLEVRKPEYDQLPQRICLHEDLIYAYLYTDPPGYDDRIGQALDFMREQVADDLECRYCVQNCATEWHLRCGRLGEAEQSARRALTIADAERQRPTADHHASAAHADLCEIMFIRGDWEALRGHAVAGEEVARRLDRVRALPGFLLWRAILARRDGDEAEARRLLRQAAARKARTRSVQGMQFDDALRAFHEMGGELEAALHVRDQELETIAGKGLLHRECRAHVHRCRLLARMGLPLADGLAAAREAAGKLRDPAVHLQELDRIEAGTGGGQ